MQLSTDTQRDDKEQKDQLFSLTKDNRKGCSGLS